MNIYVWCANHEIADEQINELINRDTHSGNKILYLANINPELHKDMCNIKEGTDYSYLAKRLISQITEISNSEPRDTVYIVQPAGNPKFQYYLGLLQGTKIGRRIPIVFYSYSKRISQDIKQADGSTKNVSVFKHIKFQ
jgi:hypothetical protein